MAHNLELAYVSCATAAHAGCTDNGRLLSSRDLARTLRGNRALGLRTLTRAWHYLLTLPNQSPRSSFKTLFSQTEGVSAGQTSSNAKAGTSVSGDGVHQTKRQKMNDGVLEPFVRAVSCALVNKNARQNMVRTTGAVPAHFTPGAAYSSLLRQNLPKLLIQTVMVHGMRAGTAFDDLLR